MGLLRPFHCGLEEANKALAECVDGVLEQMDDMTKINEEIARTAEAMAKIAKNLG